MCVISSVNYKMYHHYSVTSDLFLIFWMSSLTVYYIDCTLLFAIIKHLKKELVFHCWMLNDIFHYGDIGTEMSHSEMIFFISLSEISLFLSFSEILVFLSFSEILVFLSLSEILVFLSLSEILVFLPLSAISVFLPLSEILVFLSLSKILFFLSLSKICVFLSFVNLSISQTCNKHKTYIFSICEWNTINNLIYSNKKLQFKFLVQCFWKKFKHRIKPCN